MLRLGLAQPGGINYVCIVDGGDDPICPVGVSLCPSGSARSLICTRSTTATRNQNHLTCYSGQCPAATPQLYLKTGLFCFFLQATNNITMISDSEKKSSAVNDNTPPPYIAITPSSEPIAVFLASDEKSPPVSPHGLDSAQAELPVVVPNPIHQPWVSAMTV